MTIEITEETYPGLRKEVGELMAKTALLAELRQHQRIDNRTVLQIATYMFWVVKDELAQPYNIDQGIKVTPVFQAKGSITGTEVCLHLPGNGAYFAVVAEGPVEKEGPVLFKYGADPVPPTGNPRERGGVWTTAAELLGKGKLQEAILAFLKWYAKGCPED